MKKYETVEKEVGQTPLECVELFRKKENIESDVPIAYAGRLDPMASGTLLLLIGDECKNQKDYHALDKEYVVEILFGLSSDSGDVLGLVTKCNQQEMSEQKLQHVLRELTGEIELPYPAFSSKTIAGVPLHTWAVQDKLSEIDIPLNKTHIHKLKLLELQKISLEDIYHTSLTKIKSIKEVTDERKALGRDFRREDVIKSWDEVHEKNQTEKFYVARFACVCSSGTYMRLVCEEIGKRMDTCGLAYSIHRNTIGKYHKLPFGIGFWRPKF